MCSAKVTAQVPSSSAAAAGKSVCGEIILSPTQQSTIHQIMAEGGVTSSNRMRRAGSAGGGTSASGSCGGQTDCSDDDLESSQVSLFLQFY